MKAILLLFVFLNAGFCIGSKIPDLPKNSNEPLYAKKWEKYGAYYDID